MEQTLKQVIDAFESYRMAPSPIDQYETMGKSVLADKLRPFISKGIPIDFIMLGFPFKSTNVRDKVLGDTPDMAEQLTIRNFTSFSDTVKQIYSPGLNINIASDGYVFNDLLEVEDNTVQAYKEICLDMGQQERAPFNIIDLNDLYSGGSLSTKREKLISQFGLTNEQLEYRILYEPDTNSLYKGMIRFMEEELAMHDYPSTNQRTKAAKQLARNMMFMNEAYSNIITHEFPDMVRLSMHQSINNGKKFSFKLLPGNTKHSAWHSAVVLDSNGNITTMHKKDAINNGFELVYTNGKPNHFRS